jgi:hypothetical protein
MDIQFRDMSRPVALSATAQGPRPEIDTPPSSPELQLGTGDQLQTQPVGRSAVQAVLSLWQDTPALITPADTSWAQELLGKTRNGYHPTVDEMGRYRTIAKGTATLPPVYTLADIAPVMQHLLPTLDSNRNGFLADSELKTAIRNPRFKGPEAVAVAALNKLNGSIQKLSWNEWNQTSGVHPKDLKGLSRMAQREKPSKWTLYVESFVFNQGLRLKQIDQRLFPEGLASIRPDNIRQGDYGTCTLLAAAASLAATPQGKQALFNMIREQPDGRFEVAFPGEQPLKVSRPTDTEMILYANSGPDGLWLSVLEKAFVARMEQQMSGAPQEAVDKAVNNGYYMAKGIELLTGHAAKDGSIPQTQLPQLRDFVKQTTQEGRILLVTLDPDSAQAKAKELKEKTARSEEIYADGLVGLHAYSVIGYDPAQDTITLRNPWGHTEPGTQGKPADGIDDGIFSLKLAEFHQLFSDISWQTRDRLP